MKTPFQNFMDQAKKFQEGIQKQQHDMGAYYWTLEQKRKNEMARKSSGQLKTDSGRPFNGLDQIVSRRPNLIKPSQNKILGNQHETRFQNKDGISPRVGRERGEGSRYDSAKRVPGGPLDLGTQSRPRFQGAALPMAKRGSIFKAFVVSVIGVAISFGLFMAAGAITNKIFHIGPLSFGIGFLAGMVSLLATIKKARRAARGY